MKEIAFNDLGMESVIDVRPVVLTDDITLEVRSRLPMAEKIELLEFVVNSALDDVTGTFSPVRTEVWFAIAVCRWYAGITFDEENLQDILRVYDVLDTNQVINKIISAISSEDYAFMESLVNATVEDIARYNLSAAGIIHNMSDNASNVDEQLTVILEKIKNKEGLETLSVIKDMVGTD